MEHVVHRGRCGQGVQLLHVHSITNAHGEHVDPVHPHLGRLLRGHLGLVRFAVRHYDGDVGDVLAGAVCGRKHDVTGVADCGRGVRVAPYLLDLAEGRLDRTLVRVRVQVEVQECPVAEGHGPHPGMVRPDEELVDDVTHEPELTLEVGRADAP